MENNVKENTVLTLYGFPLKSRLLVGTAQYPSPRILEQTLTAVTPGMITVSLRRQQVDASVTPNNRFWEFIRQLSLPILPNTAGCYSVKEAITVAKMSQEVFETDFIKVEITGDDYNLQPDPFALVEACQALVKQGFKVLPYCTDDLVVCQRLLDVGCEALMPWGAPIGTGKGLVNPEALKTLRARLPDVPMLIDAGIGKPSDAVQAMQMGFDGVLLNTAIAQAKNPVMMAQAFEKSVEAGRLAYLASPMQERELASPSTPTLGTPFWHFDKN